MSLKKDGIIVILSSPSGAGKTTLVNLISEKKKFIKSVSHTTRKPRSNEIDGKHYFFVSEEEFQNLIKNNEFLEYAKVFNNLYGTSKKPVLENLQKGNNVIFDIDWQGTEQIRSINIKYKILTFFVLPPSKEILYARLTNRDMKDKLIASERMKEFYKDVKRWIDYDYVVINDELNKCYEEISKILDSSYQDNKKIEYDKNLIKEHIRKLTS